MVNNSKRNDTDYWKYIRDTILSPRSHEVFAGIDTKIRQLDTQNKVPKRVSKGGNPSVKFSSDVRDVPEIKMDFNHENTAENSFKQAKFDVEMRMRDVEQGMEQRLKLGGKKSNRYLQKFSPYNTIDIPRKTPSPLERPSKTTTNQQIENPFRPYSTMEKSQELPSTPRLGKSRKNDGSKTERRRFDKGRKTVGYYPDRRSPTPPGRKSVGGYTDRRSPSPVVLSSKKARQDDIFLRKMLEVVERHCKTCKKFRDELKAICPK